MAVTIEDASTVLPKIVAIAQTKGDGQFTIRITTKRAGTMVPVTVAVFNNASLQHISSVEGWLQALVGGGEYAIVVNHASDLGLRHVFSVNMLGDPYAHPNVAALNSPAWSGPTDIAQHMPAVQQAPVAPVPQLPAFSTPIVRAGYQQPGSIPVTPAGAQAAAQMGGGGADYLLTVQREEARANQALAQREADLKQRETESRMRAEAQEREAVLKREMHELKAAVTQRPPEKTGPSLTETIAALATAFAPLAKALVDSNTETRRLQIEANQKAAETAAQNARQLAEMQLEATRQNSAMMMKMMENNNKGMSPEMTAMLELNKSHTESHSQMMAQMISATGMVSKMSIGMIETIADMTAPPEGSPVLEAVKEGTKALSMLMRGAETGAKSTVQVGNAAAQKAAQQKPVGLPPGQRPPTQQEIEAAKARAAQVNQQAAQQQAAAVAAKPAPQTPPANVVQFPGPQQTPVAPPAEQVVDAAPMPGNTAAFGEIPDPFSSIPTKTCVDELKDLITKRHEPTDAVATFFIDSLKEPAMQGLLSHPEVMGDPNKLFAKEFGFDWIVANSDYVEKLAESLERIGTERGVIKSEEAPEDDDDGQDDDDQGDENQPEEPEAPAPTGTEPQ